MDQNLNKIKLKIVDGAFSHCEYSNNPTPPLQKSPYLYWDRSPNINQNETLFVTESNIMNPSIINLPIKKIAWLLECKFFSPMNYYWIESNYKNYDYVLTHDKEIIPKIPNALWLPTGGCWVSNSDWSCEYQKNKLVSMMISDKTQLEGHKLRHKIKNENLPIDIFGRGFNYVENKITALKDYKFHVTIENSRVPGYFTEKLIDCFVTGTIPIYWGDPKIDEVFDTSGMIIVNSFEEINEVINEIQKIDFELYKTGIKNNFDESKKYILSENYLYENYKFLIQ